MIKNILIGLLICCVALFIVTLLIGFILGPGWSLVCNIWGMILGYDNKYPACYYPHWWR